MNIEKLIEQTILEKSNESKLDLKDVKTIENFEKELSTLCTELRDKIGYAKKFIKKLEIGDEKSKDVLNKIDTNFQNFILAIDSFDTYFESNSTKLKSIIRSVLRADGSSYF